MDKWTTISGYEIYVIDGKVKRAVKIDGSGERVTAYVYRQRGKEWIKDEGSTPAAVRSGLKRGTIKIV